MKLKLILLILLLQLVISCKEDSVNVIEDVEVILPVGDVIEVVEVTEEEEAVVEVEDIIIVDEEITPLTIEDIMWIQESLKIAGYYTSMDGSFGNDTKSKLRDFKESIGLSSDDKYTTETKRYFEEIRANKLAPEIGSYMVLLNKTNYIPSSYIPDNLVSTTVRRNKEIELVKEVSDKVTEMFNDAEKDGLYIYLASGYRSYFYQEGIFSRRVSSHGFSEAETVVAIPGQSEHQTGLAIDITNEAMGFRLDQDFDEQAEFEWMMDNCYKYGFILRYRDGKEEQTGYIYEPWHYRYIGDVEAAKMIMENEFILEEYFEEN